MKKLLAFAGLVSPVVFITLMAAKANLVVIALLLFGSVPVAIGLRSVLGLIFGLVNQAGFSFVDAGFAAL